MTASNPPSAPDPTPAGPIDYRGPSPARTGPESGIIAPLLALLATTSALPAGLIVYLVAPQRRTGALPVIWIERLGFTSADWAGFLTVAGLALIGAMMGHWSRQKSRAYSLRGRAMATLASYGGFLILLACMVVLLNASSHV